MNKERTRAIDTTITKQERHNYRNKAIHQYIQTYGKKEITKYIKEGRTNELNK